jgi:RCR-type E3 ubiquitin transferase
VHYDIPTRRICRKRSSLSRSHCIALSVRIKLKFGEHLNIFFFFNSSRVCFPDVVRWMCLEFDSQCCTAQVEDSLQIYLPSASSRNSEDQSSLSDYWPVSSKFNGANNWPKASLVLPGNEVVFSLETASDYVRNDKASSWGFRCSVVGYEWPDNVTGGFNGIRQLETELSYLGGMCAASLMKRDLSLPSPTGSSIYKQNCIDCNRHIT